MENVLLSKQLINGFIQHELDEFKEEYLQAGTSRILEIRALSIAWMCYYFRQHVAEEIRRAILSYVDEMLYHEDFQLKGWTRLPGLLSAAYALGRNPKYTDALAGCLSKGDRQAHAYILESLGIVAPQITFGSQKLRMATESAIELRHVLGMEHLVVYLFTIGDKNSKKVWMRQVLDRYPEFGSQFHQAAKLEDGFHTSFFLTALAHIQSYILLKLLLEPNLASFQIGIMEQNLKPFRRVWEEVHAHPLNTSSFDLTSFI